MLRVSTSSGNRRKTLVAASAGPILDPYGIGALELGIRVIEDSKRGEQHFFGNCASVIGVLDFAEAMVKLREIASQQHAPRFGLRRAGGNLRKCRRTPQQE